MKIALIGNGFDLRHEIPTKFDDFMKYFQEKYKNKNVIFNYFDKVNMSNKWLDFENELLEFLLMLSKLRNSVSFLSDNRYLIGRSDFVSSLKKQLFYNTIEEMDYRFFEHHAILDSIQIKDDSWQSHLIKNVENDFIVLKKTLRIYLEKVNMEYSINFKNLESSEIDVIRSADSIYTFNYTKFLEEYVDKERIYYAHGSLDKDIVLGIPYSELMDIKELNFIFKTSQSIEMKLNMPIIRSDSERIDLFFIGLSFGSSDHYFFQEIKDYIMMLYDRNVFATANIYFNIYYRNKADISSYIYNLRQFLGEEMLTRFDLEDRIIFIPYE